MYKLSLGNKSEYILRKYLENLKKRISMRQIEEAQQQKERLVNNIMQKLNYNRSLKMITTDKSKVNQDMKENIMNNRVLRSKQFDFVKKDECVKNNHTKIATVESNEDTLETDSSILTEENEEDLEIDQF